MTILGRTVIQVALTVAVVMPTLSSKDSYGKEAPAEFLEVRGGAKYQSVEPSGRQGTPSVAFETGSTASPRAILVSRGSPITLEAAEPTVASAPTSWNCSEITAAALTVGFTPDTAHTIAQIALAESGGRAAATHITSKEYSVGPLQVNRFAWPQYSEESLRTLSGALTASFAISRGGTSFTPWTVWRNGTYEGMCL